MARTFPRSGKSTVGAVKTPATLRKAQKRSLAEDVSKTTTRPRKVARKTRTPSSPDVNRGSSPDWSEPQAELQNSLQRQLEPQLEQQQELEPPLEEVTPAATAAATVATATAVCTSQPQISEALRDLEAVVITLERRTDRWNGCVARLQAYCPWLSHSRFAATDGKATKISESDVAMRWNTGKNTIYQKRRAIRKGWDDLDSYVVRDLPLSPGERGCSMSHIRAWRMCIERAGNTERPLVVLEDDAAPTPEFTASLERAMRDTPSDAHVLYLGYSQAVEWRRDVSRDVVESEYVWTTVGYIVWPAGARLLLDRLPVDGPVDNWMALACAEGPLKAYCVRPKIIRQADEWNTNSDVAHSDECYWGPDSDIKHSDDFYWGALPADHPRLTGVPAAPEGAATAMVSADSAPNDTEEAPAIGGGRFVEGGSLTWDIDSEDSDDDAPKP